MKKNNQVSSKGKKRLFYILPLLLLLTLSIASAFELSDLTFIGVAEDGAISLPDITSAFMVSDGLSVITTDGTGAYIKEQSLTQAYNISTLQSSYTQYTYTDTTIDALGQYWSDDGLNLYIAEYDAKAIIWFQTAQSFNISGLSEAGRKTFAYGLEDMTLINSGTQVIWYSDATDKMYKYNLTTPYNITTADTLDSSSVAFDDDFGLGYIKGFEFVSPTQFIVSDTQTIYLFNLTSDYDITNPVLNDSLLVGYTNFKGVNSLTHNNTFSLFLTGYGSDYIVQYDANMIPQQAPNSATSINPSNTTITLNSTPQTINFNWTGGDDNNSDEVTAQVYVSRLGVKTFIGNTTTTNLNVSLGNTNFSTSNLYKVYLNLTDGTDYTISEGELFSFCVSEWTPNNTSCTSNLQTLYYTDDNSCPLLYDLPSDNGTISACDVGSSTITTIDNTENYKFYLLVGLGILFLILWFITKNSVVGFINIFYLLSLLVYFHETIGEVTLDIGLAMLSIVYIFIEFLMLKNS